jgi:hypothetical protein
LDTIGKVALWVPVIPPTQLSVAIGALKEVTAHEEFISAKFAKAGTGAVTSSTITVCVCDEVVPAASE